MKLTVNLGADSYPIYIENHILEPVSYTHLDVYKRQSVNRVRSGTKQH